MSGALNELTALCDLLRSKGVKSYKGPITGTEGLVEVELGLSTDNIEDARPGTAVGPEMCRCGHPLFAHEGGLCCLADCALDTCAPPATTKEA